MKVLVCGGRSFADSALLDTVMVNVNVEYDGIDVIIEGDARGADKMAGRWADHMGIEKEVYPAKWNIYGKRAGYVRNQQMLDEGHPDLVVAFPGGRGTDMMCKIAEDAGVEVRRIK